MRLLVVRLLLLLLSVLQLSYLLADASVPTKKRGGGGGAKVCSSPGAQYFRNATGSDIICSHAHDHDYSFFTILLRLNCHSITKYICAVYLHLIILLCNILEYSNLSSSSVHLIAAVQCQLVSINEPLLSLNRHI